MESYPPLFREASPHLDPDSPSSNPNTQPDLDLPSIDLTRLDPTQLGQACRNFGLFRLINHGIPSALSAQLHAEAEGILSLPFESKEAGFLHPIHYFWGTPALTLSVKNLNWVEGLHVPLARIQSRREELEDLHCCSSFRSLVNEYGEHMARIARTIFDALAIDLKLDCSLSASYLSESDGMLRIYRYPCCPDTSSYLGMVAHTDSSVLSVLNQDDVGGLQILHNNQWFNVIPIPDTLIVNVGDMMQAMSNDQYKSVEHRVLANGSRERMSFCYFAFPLEDVLIVSSTYRAFTYKEFRAQVQEDTKVYGSKVGLKNFKTQNPNQVM